MRFRFPIIALLLAIAIFGLMRLRKSTDTAWAVGDKEMSNTVSAASASTTTTARVDFVTNVRPILEKCQPCHFNGGKMYEQLPFDRPETVKKLGTKLFTRIHEENDRRIIREFLALE